MKERQEIRDLGNRIKELQEKQKELEEKLKQTQERTIEIQQVLDVRFPSPVTQMQEDLALYEGIFDILTKPRPGGPLVTLKEADAAMDLYKQIWPAIVSLLIDKGITTAKELHCEMQAFHHFLRIEGSRSGKSREQIFEERQKYVAELMAMPDPLVMIGR
jgi:hypothetical protein